MRRRNGGGGGSGTAEPANYASDLRQWSDKCQFCVFWALRQVSCAGTVRGLFLGEVAPELGPEGAGAHRLAEGTREAVLTCQAGQVGGAAQVRGADRRSGRKPVVSAGGGEAASSPRLHSHFPRPHPSRSAPGLAHLPASSWLIKLFTTCALSPEALLWRLSLLTALETPHSAFASTDFSYRNPHPLLPWGHGPCQAGLIPETVPWKTGRVALLRWASFPVRQETR